MPPAWSFMDQAARMEYDRERSIKHDAFMSMLGAICRNLGIEKNDDIMSDRKRKEILSAILRCSWRWNIR